MNKFYVSVGLFLLLFSCNKEAEKSPNFDYGTVENGRYHNNYFDFEMPVNANWHVQPKEEQILLTTKNKTESNAGNAKNDQQLKASEVASSVLLFTSKYPAEAVQTENPSMFINAVNLDKYPEMKTPSDYIATTRKILDKTPLIIIYNKEPYSKNIGGADFEIMEIHNQDYNLTQEYLATIQNGFALSIVIAYTSEQQKAELYKMIDHIKFN